MKHCLAGLEGNHVYRTQVLGEPQLGRRGLYPQLSTKETRRTVRDLMNVLAYCDGAHDLVAVADRTGVPLDRCRELAGRLEAQGVLERMERSGSEVDG